MQLIGVSLALAACDRAEAPSHHREPEPASPASVAQAIGVDAAELVAPVDPAPPAGDLASELARFSTLDACVKEHAALDPLVGDALRSIGYETFLRDACRLLEATKAKSVRRCDPIDASALRERCEAYVAMATASPDSCPWSVPSEPSRGRDAGCIAVASRDARLCAGEERGKRATCEAIVLRDDAHCGEAPDVARAECRRETARWRSLLPEPQKLADLPPARGRLELRGADGTADPGASTDWTVDLARGVVLVLAGDGDHATLGSARELSAPALVPGPNTSPRFALAFAMTHEPPADARLEHLELEVPGSAAIVCPGARCDLRVAVRKLEQVRGGAVTFGVDGTLGTAPHAYRVHAEAQTFVRDVVKQGIRALDAGPVLPR
jgi:hypothetical protein